jgi:23S rRNA pseudouridine955/2504/2580 synthase
LKEFAIRDNDAGQRLDRFTGKAVPLLPASLAQKYIRLGRVKLNGRPAARGVRLRAGDVVQMYIADEFFAGSGKAAAYMAIADPGLDIVYEDENILLVNKRAGMLCHPGGDGGVTDTVVARIQSHLFQTGQWRPGAEASFTPALCNRIDRNTSGLVIAAKNAESLRIINEKIRAREVDKYYLAAVHGEPSPPRGRLDGYIFKDSVKNRVFASEKRSPGAREAVTEYRSVAASGGLSLLECRLLTGRTHQIRAQLARAGWPLLGDGKYGRGDLDSLYGVRRQALCAHRLAFTFQTDAASLDYLSGREFSVAAADFVKEYFGDYAAARAAH